MTPQEHAKELARKFTKVNRGNATFNSKYNNGIRSAIICCDVVIDTVVNNPITINFWKETREELKNL